MTPAPLNAPRAIGWAAFLACSWTWCIGMFLPVFLVADFGWPGWVAFAVPNVLGAAAVGLSLRREGASDDFVRRHAAAMRAFSVVTVLFHVSFLAWFLRLALNGFAGLSLGAWDATALVGGLFVLALALGLLPSGAWRALGVACWLLSLLCAVMAWWTTGGEMFEIPPAQGRWPIADLLWGAPVLAFGFLLCPWLDLSLHRARREAPGRTGDAAFAVGFGGLFLVMITISLLYAGPIQRTWWNLYLVLHIVAQCVFTIGAHMRELGASRAVPTPSDARPRRRLSGAARLVVILGAPVVFGSAFAAFSGRERLLYELFMSAYGLVFPAYMWIVAIPRASLSRRRSMAAFWIAVVATIPFFWFGYIEHLWWPLGPGIAILLTAPLIARHMPPWVGEPATRDSAEP